MKFILTEDINNYYRYILYNVETNKYESFLLDWKNIWKII